jgi:hypothetical protein
VKYVRRRCLQRVNLLKSVAGVSWGAHSSCLIPAEWGTHWIGPLSEMLGVLGALNMGRCIKGYPDVLSLDIVLSESFKWHELPALFGTPLLDGHMEKKLANVQEAMYPLVVPRELLTVTSWYGPWCIFYTDGSLIEGGADFAVHKMGVGGFEYKIQGLAGVFTAELSFLLFTATRHVAWVIWLPERCLILTDSLSTIKAMLSRKIAHQTHPLVYECKQLYWSLCQNGIEVKLMWIPSHVVGNELVDDRAGHDMRHWKVPSLTDHYLRAMSRVWLRGYL